MFYKFVFMHDVEHIKNIHSYAVFIFRSFIYVFTEAYPIPPQLYPVLRQVTGSHSLSLRSIVQLWICPYYTLLYLVMFTDENCVGLLISHFSPCSTHVIFLFVVIPTTLPMSHNAWKPFAETQSWRKLAKPHHRGVHISFRFTQLMRSCVTKVFVCTHVQWYYSSSSGRFSSNVRYHHVAFFFFFPNGRYILIITGRFGPTPETCEHWTTYRWVHIRIWRHMFLEREYLLV